MCNDNLGFIDIEARATTVMKKNQDQPYQWSRAAINLILALSILLLLCSSSALFDDPVLVVDKEGRFSVEKWSVYGMSDQHYTQAEQQTHFAACQRIADEMRKNPVLQQPRGFDCKVLLFGNYSDLQRNYGIPCTISFQFCPWWSHKGKVYCSSIEPPHWDTICNQIRTMTGAGFESSTQKPDEITNRNFNEARWKKAASELKDCFYATGRREKLAPGVDRYNTENLVVYNPARPAYWLPMTIREIYTLLIEYWRNHPDDMQSKLFTNSLMKDYATYNAKELESFAFFGPRTPQSLLAICTDSTNLPIMKLNPNYWNKQLPRTSIQLMMFHCYATKAYYARDKAKQLKYQDPTYHVSRFLEQLDTLSLQKLIDR